MNAEPRRVQLDSLRWFAVFAVLLHHSGVKLGVPGPLAKFDAGHLGVNLFFVLSGYLITGILLGDKDALTRGASFGALLKRFYLRRFLRIMPVYYAALLALLALDFERSRELWPWLVSYTINLRIAYQGEWPGHLSHFWSLAVEQQFYLLWPWLLLTVRSRWLVPAMCVAAAVGPLSRLLIVLFMSSDLRDGGYTSVAFPGTAFDSLAAGGLLAWAFRARSAPLLRRALTRRVLPLGAAGILAAMALDELFWGGYTWFVLGDVAVATVFAWLVGITAMGVPGVLGRVLAWRLLVWLGSISYGIYLFHLPLLELLLSSSAGSRFDLASSAPAKLVACAVPSLALAAASFHWFEQPLRVAALKLLSSSKEPRAAG